MNITFEGYLFIFIIILSFFLGKTWFSSKKDQKPGCLITGTAAIIISMFILFPVMMLIQFFGHGSIPIKLGITLFWISLTVIIVYITKSRKKQFGIFLVKIFFGIGGLMLLGMMGGMGYYVYLRLFTHQKDNDKAWPALICIFFLSVLILVLVGFLFKGKKGDLITEFDNLDEAKRNAGNVLSLDLSGKGLDMFPKEILKFNGLTSLDLSNNQITEIPAALSKMKHLQTIKLSQNPISDQQRAIIRKLFPPEIEIIFRK